MCVCVCVVCVCARLCVCVVVRPGLGEPPSTHLYCGARLCQPGNQHIKTLVLCQCKAIEVTDDSLDDPGVS